MGLPVAQNKMCLVVRPGLRPEDPGLSPDLSPGKEA